MALHFLDPLVFSSTGACVKVGSADDGSADGEAVTGASVGL